MKIRQDIADMLRAGDSMAQVQRTLGVGYSLVSDHRKALRLPLHPPSVRAETVEATFARRTRATDDGHLVWTGSTLAIKTVEGANLSAARYAFQQQHGRRPVGRVLPGCGVLRCVHPKHVEDQPMREALDSQLAAILGSAA
ncbi:hypothetical protein [Streptomyces sp. NBC_00233]|uniref:hypothetical protein n=1 Tax=Streptomyces sp. NBC_00233 TaxID=2975686 RepID=UPI002257BC94|nr:hypothetical protein [Streptomyces sp. NBC_00233]MCX5229716.1 hypothetical protein [Streptomyces sp. NBC_00233]